LNPRRSPCRPQLILYGGTTTALWSFLLNKLCLDNITPGVSKASLHCLYNNWLLHTIQDAARLYLSIMTTLPSFVELMSSLGFDKHSERSPPLSPSSSAASSPRIPIITTSHSIHSRSTSRDRVSPSRHRIARYSPYHLSARRGSLPLTSSITTHFHQPMRASSTSPSPSSTASRRRNDMNLSPNVYESMSDLTANTPISTYVRRKTPSISSISPTSPTFPRDNYSPDTDSPTACPMPFSLPTLPSLFPKSMDTYSFPPTPESDIHQPTSEPKSCHAKFLPEISEVETYNHRFYYTNVRISTPH